MFTATKNLMLPATVTGSWPRPRWFDVSMWGKSIDTCMMDVRFREKFQDALAVVVSEQERAGLDLITHGDYHCDEDMAGRAWHHYPLQRWAGFEGDYLQPEETRAPWLHYPPGHAPERDLHRAGAGRMSSTRSSIGRLDTRKSGASRRARRRSRSASARAARR
jgi:hypothetical protein